MSRLSEPGRAAKAQLRRQSIRSWYEGVMAKKVCADCGEARRAVLDWHHEDPRLKTHTIPWMVARGWSIGRIQEEMAKCVVLCSNCHRVRHWEERYGRTEREAA